MYYVYILKSLKDKRLYVGYTKNLKNRLTEHFCGETVSTKFRRPLQLIYCEAYLSKLDAERREKFFKSGWGRKYIKKNLKYTLLKCN